MEHIFTINNAWKTGDILQLIQLGYYQFRINGIHISAETCDMLKVIRNKKLKIKLYYDLPGNKCRIWTGSGEKIEKKINEEIFITKKNKESELYVTGEAFWNNIKVGDKLTTRQIGRKCVEFIVEDIGDNFVKGRILKDGVLGYGYHIYNPQNYWQNTCINEADYYQFDKITYLKPEVIAVSFADSYELIKKYKKVFPDKEIFAKIESPVAVDNIDQIMDIADGIIIARDDLSAFFSNDDISIIVASILEMGKQNNKKIIGASNYFNGVYHYGVQNSVEKDDYYFLKKNGASGVYINETNKDCDWKKYVKVICYENT